jgi:DNA-binding NtrC family response regulator
MAKLWIVHRDAQWRDALVAMAGSLDVLAGDPVAASGFDAAPAPRAVLLGVAGDFEAELEFAHRFGPRLAGTAWVLLARPLDAPEVARLFDALPATLVSIASDAGLLRRRVRAALAKRRAAALTTRQHRDALAARFARWFGDLELPALLAATDPARGSLPLVVRGEPGTGRALLARYLHLMTTPDPAALFASVSCAHETDPLGALTRLAREIAEGATAGAMTVCLEDVDWLAAGTQRALRTWIEEGPPAGPLRASRVRWIATAADPHGDDAHWLDADLARALAGLTLRIPPLRERPAAIATIAAEEARAMAAVRGTPERRFEPAALARLVAHPWPGNHRELEALLRRTLSATTADPIPATALVFEQLDLPILEPEYLDSPDPEREATREGTARQAEPPFLGGAARSEPQANEAQQDVVAPAPYEDRPSRPMQPAEQPAPDTTALRRLSAAVAHEVGNPLVGIRTYAAMLPMRFDDAEFRSQFAERVETDTRRIEAVIETLTRLGALESPERAEVDVSSLLAHLLERERPRIRERRLVVLEELDRAQPFALGDEGQLRFAFGLLFEQALGWMPARGDLYVATRHRAEPTPMLRILLRFRDTNGYGLGFGENALAVSAVEAVVNAHGGSLAVENGASGDTSVLIELPAPGERAPER